MLVVETVVRIRREHAGSKPIKEIARDLRLSRKAIRAPEGGFDYHRSVQPLPRIAPFQERLDVLLAENEARPRRDRLRMTRIHDLLLREGFEGSYDAIRRYAARWSEARRKDPGASVEGGVAAFIPMLFRRGRGVPVRLEPRRRGDRGQADAREGRPPAVVRFAGGLCPGLSA